MRPFTIERALDLERALAAVGDDPEAAFVAGGTELVNWLKEGIASPRRLVDISRLPLAAIGLEGGMLRIGALARMSEVAAHAEVRAHAPALAESLELSASAQLRNMATMGGNLMQRTRCPYFRAETALPCNKRAPGSGCSAIAGSSRDAAIFGANESCVATHPSDAAVALSALEAIVRVRGVRGERAIPLDAFYRLPEADAQRETVLEHGELIAGIEIAVSPLTARSRYLKVRPRASYEFALVSAAAAVLCEGDRIVEARLALGGAGTKPWRLRAAEDALRGATLEPAALRAAIEPSFEDARPLRDNAFKIELVTRAAVRALCLAAGAA